ncbi:MAG: hypothetical protein GY950_21410, partial [bacterium]|nr:hypothetical protein [bacterium]
VKTHIHELDPQLQQQLYETAGKYHTTARSLCFGAYIKMLSVIAGQTDIVAGLAVHNRPVCQDGEKILGCFLNTVPVRVRFPAGITWRAFISLVDKKLLEMTAYGRLPFLEIVKHSGEKTRDQNPLFDTLFNWVDFHVYHQAQKEPAAKIDPADSRAYAAVGRLVTNTLMDFNIEATTGSLLLCLSYAEEIMDNDMAEYVCAYYQKILKTLAQKPEGLVDDVQETPLHGNGTGKELKDT